MLLNNHHNDPEHLLPSVLISAGIHGDEIGSMFLLTKLEELFIREKWPINATFANYCNPSAIRAKHRESTGVDGADMNRGWLYESARTELSEVVKNFDVLFDLHCSWKSTEFFLCNNGQNISYEWLEKQGIPFGVREGSPDTLKMHATRECQMGFTWEMMGMEHVNEESVARSLAIFVKILSNWKEFCKNAYGDKECRKLTADKLIQAVVPRTEGVVHWRLKDTGLGQKVSYGEELGKIISIDDGTVSEILTAPCAGRIMYVGASYATPYDNIMGIQPNIGR